MLDTDDSDLIEDQHPFSFNLGIKIFLYFQVAVNVVTILFDLQLIWFHVWISGRGITTFDYITYKRVLAGKQKLLKVSSCVTRETLIDFDVHYVLIGR